MTQISRLLPIVGLSAALTLGAVTAHATDEKPKIVASLSPIELLVRAVAGDQVTVSTLVPAGASPHTYQLRPSERRQLAAADRIFWVGPGMESFLERLLTGPDFRDQSVALAQGADSPGDDARGHHDQVRQGDHTEAEHGQEHDSADAHDHGHGHDHGDGEDPHIWLDPTLALDMAGKVAHSIEDLEGIDAEQVDRNLANFKVALKEREAAIRVQLQPAKDLDLFTYHDAFRRFAEHYGLTIAGVLTLSPERSPGARHLAEVQQRLQQADQPCLLTEPQFNRQWWESLMTDVEIPISTWDPLAGDIEPTATGYLEFQQSLADAVLRCLPENAE